MGSSCRDNLENSPHDFAQQDGNSCIYVSHAVQYNIHLSESRMFHLNFFVLPNLADNSSPDEQRDPERELSPAKSHHRSRLQGLSRPGAHDLAVPVQLIVPAVGLKADNERYEEEDQAGDLEECARVGRANKNPAARVSSSMNEDGELICVKEVSR